MHTLFKPYRVLIRRIYVFILTWFKTRYGLNQETKQANMRTSITIRNIWLYINQKFQHEFKVIMMGGSIHEYRDSIMWSNYYTHKLLDINTGGNLFIIKYCSSISADSDRDRKGLRLILNHDENHPAVTLLDEWESEESDYDELAWPEIKESLNENPIRFREPEKS